MVLDKKDNIIVRDLKWFAKMFPMIIMTVGLIIVLSGLIYTGLATFDNLNDVRMCHGGMSVYDYESVACFANDDFWKINFGFDITCECFFSEVNAFGSKSFEVN